MIEVAVLKVMGVEVAVVVMVVITIVILLVSIVACSRVYGK